MKRGMFLGALALALAVVACDNETEPKLDQGGGQDDVGVVDAGLDGPPPDGALPDTAAPDSAVDAPADSGTLDTVTEDAGGADTVALDTLSPDTLTPDTGPDACVPTTCNAAGKDCGKIFDLCGGVLDCGTCSFPQSCGGGGTTNVCGCQATWQASAVDSSGSVGSDSAVVVDDKLGVHVSYYDQTSTALKYAYRPAGGVWTTSTVDNAASVGSYSDIALDSSGGIHIAYRDDTNQALKYATRAAGASAWTISVVEASKNAGSYAQIALDSQDGVHIAYHRAYKIAAYVTASEIKHAYRAAGGTSWTLTVVDSAAPTSIRMALDAADRVHLTYNAGSTYYGTAYLRYARRSVNGVWASETVDSSVKAVGEYSAIAVDATGRIHLSYYDATNKDLKHASRGPDGVAWIITKVDGASGDVGQYTAVGVDSVGAVRIAYYDQGNADLKVATLAPGGSWSSVAVDSTGTVGAHAALALDASNDVYVSYYDGTNLDLKLAFLPDCDSSCTKVSCSSAGASCGAIFDACGATLSCGACTFPKLCGGGGTQGSCGCTAGAWRTEPVDSPGTTGYDSAVAVDGAHGVHIAYYDKDSADLRYAYRAQGGEWKAETVDASGDVGLYASIALDSLGGVHIAYRDTTNADLKYAHRAAAATSWTIEQVETLSGSGLYTGIALDGSDGVHIAYNRVYKVAAYVTAHEIKYAYRASGGSAWSTAVVDTGETGYRIAIRIDGSGGVHMAYGAQNSYYSTGTLRYAYKPSGGTWTTAQASSASAWVGVYPSLAVDAVGTVHISHWDATNGDLVYTTKASSATAWTTATVDSTGTVGQYTAVGADSLGGVHVAYYDQTNGALKYATKPLSGSWTVSTVEATGSTGTMGWLAVDKANNVHVSYLGDTDLKYALLPKCP